MITIRNAKQNEFHTLEEISVSSMSEPWREADFISAEKNEYALIIAAVETGNPVGYAVGYFAADEAELPSIAVNPRMRRRGIGNALLKELFSQVKQRGAAKLFLEVRESNKEAISLYERNGFITAGTRRHFYSNPEEDALVMMKLL
ncbi:MAG: ribosomal protein S18-alanine N-acetyltransferase [Candidatus Weimeria sp.]